MFLAGWVSDVIETISSLSEIHARFSSKGINCLQEYKFARFDTNGETIKNAILKFQSEAPTNLPDDKMEILEDHFDSALGTFALVDKLKKVEVEYNAYAVDYRDLHFTVRKKQKKILKLNKKIDQTQN